MILTKNGELGLYEAFYKYKEAKYTFKKYSYSISQCHTRNSATWHNLNLDHYFPKKHIENERSLFH
jgi:hypothetical protein